VRSCAAALRSAAPAERSECCALASAAPAEHCDALAEATVASAERSAAFAERSDADAEPRAPNALEAATTSASAAMITPHEAVSIPNSAPVTSIADMVSTASDAEPNFRRGPPH
jgi:hypothetical protein